MNNILKSNQPCQYNTGNRNQGNLSHRKTIQAQAAEIETLRNKVKCLCGIIENHVFYEEYLEDDFFNLGDACMNRLAGLESPFQYE